MSEEISENTASLEVKMRERHELYLRAVNNPLRRKILGALKEGNMTLEELADKTYLDQPTVIWHLNFLESGLCVEKENIQGNIIYKLTQYGKVINYF